MADRIRQRSQNTKKSRKNSWRDILRLDESYTSLILGIIVVIIASLLLVSFVKNRHAQSLQQATSSISTGPTQTAFNIPLTITPTPTVTKLVGPTVIITATMAPTTVPSITVTPTPLKTGPQKVTNTETYTVKHGDDLWNIALQHYGSGYNWVDIAKVNHLTNPGILYAGLVLTLPAEAPILINTPTISPAIAQNTKGAQMNAPPAQTTQNIGQKITTPTYIVQKGDSLWTIAIRAYNDGYQWTKIAQANHIVHPSTIFSGNVLTIPR